MKNSVILSFLLLFFGTQAFAGFEIKNACSASENVNDLSTTRYGLWISKKIPKVQGFSEALTLRRKAQTAFEQNFSEYWISRTFFEFGFLQLAHQGFEQLLSRDLDGSNEDVTKVRSAALKCIYEIERKLPNLDFKPKTVAEVLSVPELAVLLKLRGQDIAWNGTSNKNLAQVLEGIDLISKKKYQKAVSLLEPLLIEKSSLVELYREEFTLLVARAQFALGNYTASRKWYSEIPRNSNQLVSAILESGWAGLKSENYAAAIGSAVSLQTGGLKRSFAPEAQMIMAMAFNELCQYPDSMKATQSLRKKYNPVFEWLEKESSKGGIYPQVISYLKKQGQLPDPIGTELIRNPIFVSAQSEINQATSLKQNYESNANTLRLEQKRKALVLLKDLRELRSQYEQSKEGWTTQVLKEKLAPFRDNLAQYRAMRQSESTWRRILTAQVSKIPERKNLLKNKVEKEFAFQLVKMRDQLEQVFENTRLVEIEILTGASEDLVWRNAHPEYQKTIEKMKEATQLNRSVASEWNWGKLSLDSDSQDEVWEDELGNFEADSKNHCDSKDKYWLSNCPEENYETKSIYLPSKIWENFRSLYGR